MSNPEIETYEARRERSARVRAAWPDQHAAVRDAVALGFWPDAYGPIGRPPTKFAYPAGGILHPFQSGGVAAGSDSWIWCFNDGNPDDLRDQPRWLCGPTTCCRGAWGLLGKQPSGMTLDAAFAWTIAAATHYRRHYLVPDPDSWPHPRLLTREWRELIDAFPPESGRQLGLFDAPDVIAGPYAATRQAIAAVLRPLAGNAPQALELGSFHASALNDLLDGFNRRRHAAGGVPPFVFESVEVAA